MTLIRRMKTANQIQLQVGIQVNSRDQIGRQVGDQASDQVWRQVVDKVWNQVLDQVWEETNENS